MPAPKSVYDILAQSQYSPQQLMTPVDAQPEDDSALNKYFQDMPNFSSVMTPAVQGKLPNATPVNSPDGGLQVSAAPKMPASMTPKSMSLSMPVNMGQPSQLDPSELEMQKQYQDLIDKNKQGISQGEADMQSLGQRPTGLAETDFSPIASLLGMQGYKAPNAQSDFDARKKLLQDSLQKKTEDQQKALYDYLKMKEDAKNRQAMMGVRLAGMDNMNDYRNRRLGLQEDSLVQRVTNSVDTNKLIENYNQQYSKMDRVMGMLDNAPDGKITNQTLADASIGIASALQQGMGSSSDEREKQMYENLYTQAAQLKSFITGNPQDIANPQVVQYIRATIAHLKDAFAEQVQQQAQLMKSGKHFSSQRVQQALNDKVDSYSTLPKSQGPLNTPDEATVAAARAEIARRKAMKATGR